VTGGKGMHMSKDQSSAPIALIAKSADAASMAAGVLDELSKAWEDAARVPANREGVVLAEVIQILDDLADRAEMIDDAAEALRIAAVTARIGTLAAEAAMVAFIRAAELEGARAAAELGIDQPSPLVDPSPAEVPCG
jgi:hypothetical protein